MKTERLLEVLMISMLAPIDYASIKLLKDAFEKVAGQNTQSPKIPKIEIAIVIK